MRRLFAVAGIDFDQWKALTVVAIKLDFRGSALSQRHDGHATNVVASLIFQAIFYTMFGGMIAYLVWASRDLWLAGTLASSYIAFIVGTAVVLDHNSVISSPVDYAILGFRPVSSRTYFAVKLTNILVYTTALTTVAAWAPIVVAAGRHGWHISAALMLDIYGTSTATTLAIALGYASVLRAVGPDAIVRVLSYVQMFMSFAVYGGQFLISGVLSRSVPGNWSMPDTPWIVLYPAAWFGSYLAVADGQMSVRYLAPALASVAALALMASRLGGRLSLEYSENLGAMTVAARAKAARVAEHRGRRAWWFSNGEARAVALLVRSQFRHDHRFRMGVLGLLPFTLLYMLMGLRNGAVTDPFMAESTNAGVADDDGRAGQSGDVEDAAHTQRVVSSVLDLLHLSERPYEDRAVVQERAGGLLSDSVSPAGVRDLLLRGRQYRPRAGPRRVPRTARAPRAAGRVTARSRAALLAADAEGSQHVDCSSASRW